MKKLPVSKSGCGGGCSRRALLQGLGMAAVGTWLLEACVQGGGSSLPSASTSSCSGGICLDLADAANSALTKVDGALLVDTSTDTIMVIRASDTSVIAVSAICTHSGCSMDYNTGTHQLDCPCHGSIFSESGQVIKGPARRSLQVYTATLANNIVTIAA